MMYQWTSDYFHLSNYYKQTEAYEGLEGAQSLIVLWADTAIYFRELSKAGATVSIVAYVASELIGHYQIHSLLSAGACVWFWRVSKYAAEQLEPKAKLIVEHLEKSRQPRNSVEV